MFHCQFILSLSCAQNHPSSPTTDGPSEVQLYTPSKTHSLWAASGASVCLWGTSDVMSASVNGKYTAGIDVSIKDYRLWSKSQYLLLHWDVFWNRTAENE